LWRAERGEGEAQSDKRRRSEKERSDEVAKRCKIECFFTGKQMEKKTD
jgi:hypothetical protein